MEFEGVYTPIVTAFDDRDALDLDANAAVIEFVLASGGMRGLVPCGTTGEYYACSMEERLRILEHTRDVTRGPRAADRRLQRGLDPRRDAGVRRGGAATWAVTR